MDALEQGRGVVSPAVVIVGVVVSALLYVAYLFALPKPLPGIPYNSEASRRLFGDLKELSQAKYQRQWMCDQPRRHGAPLAQIFTLPFCRPNVVVSGHDEVVDICSRRTKEFDIAPRNKDIVGQLAPNFHFTMQSKDPRFNAHRTLIRDLMTPKFLNEVSAPRVYDKVVALVDLWDLKAAKARGRPFSATHDLFLATLDIICSVAFSLEDDKSALLSEIRHVQSLDPAIPPDSDDAVVELGPGPVDPELDALLDMLDLVAAALTSPLPRLTHGLAALRPRNARAQRDRHALIRRQTDTSLRRLAVAGPAGCQSALDQLLWREVTAAKKADRKPDVYSPNIRDEVLGYIAAGHDTTANVSAFWIKYISRHQPVQTRLRAALHSAHPDALREARSPSQHEICTASVPYLDAVIEETLRYASIVTMVSRIATCDTLIQGYAIPKGTEILLPLIGPSITEPAPQEAQDTSEPPAWGADLDRFRPERWLKVGSDGQEIFDASAGPRMAFSAGPRRCFGQRLGVMQVRMLMTMLPWNFELEAVPEALDGADMIERLANTPKDCYARLKRIHPVALP